MDIKPPRYSKSAQLGIVVGAVLILFGLIRLSETILGTSWWTDVRHAINAVFSYIWPIALIAAGLYLVWAARKGKFKGTSLISGRSLRRSVLDKRIAGVCGGIAEFLHIDSAVVRVLVIIFLFVNPLLILILYMVAGILLSKS